MPIITITFDEVGTMLDDIADEIPGDFYRELNGGIFLLPDTKMHSENKGGVDGLYILGEYHNDRKGMGGLGRYIVIYYGSFIKLYARIPREQQKAHLRRVLLHEFTHHLESLAGEHGLAVKDAQRIDEYKKKFMK